MSNRYKSKLLNLEKISENDIKFNIPIYQRLYVWKDEQVKRLLEDTHNAFLENENKDYFLGGVIVVSNDDRYDLIDGQQRFTTLWLIAKYLKNNLEPFLNNRIHFSIRDNANKYFQEEYIDMLDDKGELSNIKNAIKTIDKFFETNESKHRNIEFAKFIFKKIQLVFTTVPQNIDLNKLFETINSGGVQLQHHELLKAEMLKQIVDNKERAIYAKMWDTCAFMDNYIENNLSVTLNCSKTDIYSGLYKEQNDLKNVDKVKDFIIKRRTKTETNDKKSLNDILNTCAIKENPEVNERENEFKVKSIISFSMLLLHSLRIYFKKNQLKDIKRIKEKELLNIFYNKESEYGIFSLNEDSVKNFINLLWDIRYAFDENIIKWVSVEDNSDELHHICKMRENKSSPSPSLQRDNDEVETIKPLSLLQSMLYHTQEVTTHYWLTPVLMHLIQDNKDNTKYLQNMDNYLFFSDNGGDLRERTWNILNADINFKMSIKDINIDEKKGVGFPHYLFYKIEYILWLLTNYKNNDFYFRAKNSVEHIEPQTEDDDKKQNENWSGDLLDTFGNLALVSRERNSEFGNLTFKEKKVKFEAFKDSNQHLKMSLIYNNNVWTDDICKEHHDEIKKKVNEYIMRNFSHDK